MTSLKQYIIDKKHHAFRKDNDWDLAGEYSAKKLSPEERMTDRFERLCAAQEPVFLPEKKAAGRNKFIRFCKYMYTKMVRESGSPDYIARGWALGMFIGCVIPVFCQLVISVPLSFVFRGSKIGAALGTFITTPPTAVFIYPIQIWIGNKVINGSLSSDAAKKLLEIFNSETLSFAEKWSAFADLGWALVAAFFAGGLLWAMVMTPLTYFLVRFLVIRYREMRSRLFAAVKGKRGQS